MECELVCSAAMNDGKSSANFVKDGIKLVQKRSNPVELFVQKRVMISFFSFSLEFTFVYSIQLDYLKKYPPSVSSAYVLVIEMLYLWILLPLCEEPTIRRMLEGKENVHTNVYLCQYVCLVIEKHGRDSKDDTKLRPITCFLEGAIHNIIHNFDDAENVCLPVYKLMISYI